MNVFAPETVRSRDTAQHTVYVNVFGGSEKSKVWMRLSPVGPWHELEKVFEKDPYYVALKEAENEPGTRRGLEMSAPQKSHHLWKGPLPAQAEPGLHRIWVKSRDMYGRVFHASRTIRVEDSLHIEIVP